MSEHIVELQDWLADLHQLVSSKTNQKEIEYAKKRIDSLEFLMEQNQCYREALKKIAVNFPFDSREDYVKIACQALERESE